MINQIKSSEIKKFVENNPKTVLLDVRTDDEWKTIGKPDSTNLGIKTFFITISQDSGFIENIKKAEKYLDLLDQHHDLFLKISEHIEIQGYDQNILSEDLIALLVHSFVQDDIDLYMQYVYAHGDVHQWERNLRAELETLGFGSIKSLVSAENRKELRAALVVELHRYAS